MVVIPLHPHAPPGLATAEGVAVLRQLVVVVVRIEQPGQGELALIGGAGSAPRLLLGFAQDREQQARQDEHYRDNGQ